MNSPVLKYCYHGQHSKPKESFKVLPGLKNKRAVCADCYEKILADRRKKSGAGKAVKSSAAA